ncbi:hypothetical protein AX13_08220 [Comamonas aquatica DA1877]|uniref:Uncharacterized protein n=1 Tax=Comamonas aquatica DA1877 TaxID=1457173 RepID=A0A014NI36_9BURK|nr:hypothetical protein AX13_08220 [Comamonas aquatica DA1877]
MLLAPSGMRRHLCAHLLHLLLVIRLSQSLVFHHQESLEAAGDL